MNKSKSLKAIVLSLGLAALMVPATMNAQINRGLLQNPYKDESNRRNDGMIQHRSGETEGFTLGGAETENPAPLGGGIFVLIAASAGYVALKKKEDKQ